MSRIVLQGAKLDAIVLHVLSNDSKEFSMPKSVACKSSEWCCTLPCQLMTPVLSAAWYYFEQPVICLSAAQLLAFQPFRMCNSTF